MKFNIYVDPEHAWCKVTIKRLLELGIAGHISSHSYINGDYAFLEEDKDMETFLNAMQKVGASVTFKENHTNKQSRIRKYDSYSTFKDEFNEDFHYNVSLDELDFIELSDDGQFYEVNMKAGIHTSFRLREVKIGASINKFRATKSILYKPPYLVIK